MSEGRIFAWTDWTDCKSVLRVLAWADTYHFIRLDGFSDQFRLDGLKIRPSVQKNTSLGRICNPSTKNIYIFNAKKETIK